MKWMFALFVLVLMVSCNPHDKVDVVGFGGYIPQYPITVVAVGEDRDIISGTVVITFKCVVKDGRGTLITLTGNQWSSLEIGDTVGE